MPTWKEKAKIYWRHPDIHVYWRAILAELLGTAIFVFLGTSSAVFANKNEPVTVALGHIFGLLVCIHIFGPISGAHFNCAVTFGALITRNIGLVSGIVYMIAQIVGSIVGAALTTLIGKTVVPGIFKPPEDIDDAWRGFALEIILTFVLVLAIFGAAVKPQHFKKSNGLHSITGLIAAFPIAFALGADAMAGALTGASMNPARAFGPQVVGGVWYAHSWIYYTAPFIGAALGAIVYEFLLTKPKKLQHYTSLLHINTNYDDSDDEKDQEEDLRSQQSNALLYTTNH
ncbi:predicted protein [Naegleria gruberi]|uniref:Predicted protein n=1 Tax=Naegleria gruberi TaxID=5762 RepID=D2W2N2_NAEGR|nr:uncharacterized protein NAEGRDRAFT_75649 [Naegleria gruberi]EFC36645.1 predicted protein [Naegleria gruberi]|eukprot:XP_002669389.1 predicted protein [Naegleria gruberi strain NEG-M]